MSTIKESLVEAQEPLEISSKGLYAILACAGFCRSLSIALVRNYKHPITWEFGEQAKTLYAGYGYVSLDPTGIRIPSAHMPPLYPYLLDAAWKMFGQSPSAYLALELFQASLGVLLVYVVYHLSAVLTSKKTALVAAAMTAVWPSFVYLCNEFHSISISILLSVAAVYYLVRLIEFSGAWKDVAAFGFCMGGLFLCRAEAVVLLPCYALILVWRCGRRRMLQAVAGSVLALACLLPWTIRNYVAFGHAVLVSTSGGFNLWVGHNAGATGNSDYELNFLRPDEKSLTDDDRLAKDREARLSHLFRHFAVDYIVHHPVKELSLSTRKAFYFVFFDPTHKKGQQAGYWIPSMLLTFLGGYGMFIEKERLLKAYLPLTFSIFFSLALAVVVFSLPRYRISVDPFLVVFAASSLTWFWEAFSGRSGFASKGRNHPTPKSSLGHRRGRSSCGPG